MHAPVPFLAEVADKEPMLVTVWCVGAFFSLFALLAVLLPRWGIFLGLLIAVSSALSFFLWLKDPDEGPAILRELGGSYVTQAYVAALFPFLFVLIGYHFRQKRIAKGIQSA
jgi:hypothetical protein